jgi:putative two-component system response regulator
VKSVLNLQLAVIKTLANLVEYRDELTGGHVERTRSYLAILLDAMVEHKLYLEEVTSWDRDLFLLSSLLHDVGKIAISDSILLKPDKLTDAEFNDMKKHTWFGVKIIEEIEKEIPESNVLSYAKTLAGTHHEKWDGNGYPDGLKGNEIPLPGRLMAIADVYDNLISTRPYKQPVAHAEAVAIIADGRGTQFDPYLVDVFLSVADKFPQFV